MEKIIYKVNAADFTSRRIAHGKLQEIFGKYEYYGSNLNALYDALTSIRRDAEIQVEGLGFARIFLYEYADRIREVFDAAAKRDRHLKIVYTEPFEEND